MKTKLFYGLMGCSSDGVLCTPSGKYSIKLPRKVAFFIHRFLNSNFAYTGRDGTTLVPWAKEG